MVGQSHPLYSIDRDHLNRLLSKKSPDEEDLVDIARLFMRYEDFPGAKDIHMDMIKILDSWGITREELNRSTREIWFKGSRSNYDSNSNEMLGSSFDTSEN